MLAFPRTVAATPTATARCSITDDSLRQQPDDGNEHNSIRCRRPAGGAAGQLRGGRHAPPPHTPMSNLLTMLY
jgi:hypothetical protein